MFDFLCLCPRQDEQQLPWVRSEVAGWGPDIICSCPEEWGWLRDPARAKLPSTATLQQYSSDQTFSLSLSVSVSASVSAPRFAIWYVTVMLPCLCDVKLTSLSLQEVAAVVSIVLFNIHYSLSQVSKWSLTGDYQMNPSWLFRVLMMIALCCMTRRPLVARSSFRTWAWWSPTRGWWWRPSWWPASSTSPSTSAAADRDTGTGGEWRQLTMWTLQTVSLCQVRSQLRRRWLLWRILQQERNT